MKPELTRAMELERKRHEETVAFIANECLADFVKTWQGEPLTMTFGMGTCAVKISGKHVFAEDYPEIDEVIQDVEDITDGYRIACPNDVTVGGA